MITREQDENGNWVELSEERKRQLNEEVLGLDQVTQNFINAIEDGELSGDARELGKDQKLQPENSEEL